MTNENTTCPSPGCVAGCVHTPEKTSYHFGIALLAGVVVAGLSALGLAIIITLAETIGKL